MKSAHSKRRGSGSGSGGRNVFVGKVARSKGYRTLRDVPPALREAIRDTARLVLLTEEVYSRRRGGAAHLQASRALCQALKLFGLDTVPVRERLEDHLTRITTPPEVHDE